MKLAKLALLFGAGVAILAAIYFFKNAMEEANLLHGLAQAPIAARVRSASAYVLPEGCPARLWTAGEFLPIDCIRGNELSPAQAALPEPANPYRELMAAYWVRSFADALLVRGPPGASGQIVAIQRDHFDGPSGRSSSTGAFRRPPPDYLLKIAAIQGAPILVLLIVGAGAWYQLRRRSASRQLT